MNAQSVGILTIAALVSGCASAPQAVVISPKVDVQASKVGAGHSINLIVIDERPRKTLGARAARQFGANLTIDGDLSVIVQQALIEGLTKQGFNPLISLNPENRALRVEIRNLDYMVLEGLFSNTLNIDTSLKAFCVRATQLNYEQLYRGEFAKETQIVSSDEENNLYISQAVSTAVNSLLKDQSLLTYLSK